jgi:hypothetical protein
MLNDPWSYPATSTQTLALAALKQSITHYLHLRERPVEPLSVNAAFQNPTQREGSPARLVLPTKKPTVME